jgi:uncharacterized protein YjbI with pentapeptide repeats
MLFLMSAIRDRAALLKRWLRYRWRRIKRLPWTVLAILVGVAVVSSLAGLRDAGQGLAELWLNLGTELAGAVVTFILIDLVLGARQRKEALITQMGSDVREVAVPAVDDLRREGWLTNGALRGADLVGARLKGANLELAHLQGADLGFARLQGVVLRLAHLEGANLEWANLEEAVLIEACLEGAVLVEANLLGAYLMDASLTGADLEHADLLGAALTGVNLTRANLKGTNLMNANLKGAFVSLEQLAEAVSLRGATLPDGTRLSGEEWEAKFKDWRKKQQEQGEQ